MMQTNEAESGTVNSREIAHTMRQAGYKKLGSGADATVWAKDSASVIKILMPDSGNVSQAASTFKEFYNFCQAHKDVPFLPKFTEIEGSHYGHFTIGGQEYIQIAMERLKPLKRNSFDEAMVWILSDFAVKAVKWEDIIPHLEAVDTWQHSEGIMKNMPEKLAKLKDNPKFNAYYGTLFTVMQMLYLTGRINKFGWDLHTENVMQRSNGTLVIVDPWFNHGMSK
jgi:hypothetical protein